MKKVMKTNKFFIPKNKFQKEMSLFQNWNIQNEMWCVWVLFNCMEFHRHKCITTFLLSNYLNTEFQYTMHTYCRLVENVLKNILLLYCGYGSIILKKYVKLCQPVSWHRREKVLEMCHLWSHLSKTQHAILAQ